MLIPQANHPNMPGQRLRFQESGNIQAWISLSSTFTHACQYGKTSYSGSELSLDAIMSPLCWTTYRVWWAKDGHHVYENTIGYFKNHSTKYICYHFETYKTINMFLAHNILIFLLTSFHFFVTKGHLLLDIHPRVNS